MTTDSDIVIVGGGLNGPALALALAPHGLRVTIVDALPLSVRRNAAFDGRAYALALASKRLLSRIGIWGHASRHAQPIEEIKASDGRPGEGPAPFFLHFQASEIEHGPMGFMLEDRFLRRAFLDAMDAHPAISQLDDRVAAQATDPTGATLTLESGDQLRARLVVGCDGRSSGTALRAGIRRAGWDYGQTALVSAVAHTRPHHGTAQQYFMPQGPLAILPLPGNVSSIVWSETNEAAAAIDALNNRDFLEVLRPRFGDFLGDIRLKGKRFSYPLALSVADRFVATRVALVGDAAHGMHPIAGQGLNAGLRDVGALAHVLIHAMKRGEDFAAQPVLERYEQWRRFDISTLAMATDISNRLFSNDSLLLRTARDIGMGLVNAVPGLRRGLIREAAGLTGNLPDLMKA